MNVSVAMQARAKLRLTVRAKYNPGFATFEHLSREAKRKPGDYEARLLSGEADTVTGVFVSQAAGKVVIWREGRFEKYAPMRCKLIDLHRLATYHPFATINLLQITLTV